LGDPFEDFVAYESYVRLDANVRDESFLHVSINRLYVDPEERFSFLAVSISDISLERAEWPIVATRGLLPFPETPIPCVQSSLALGVLFLIVAMQTGRPPAGAQAPSVKTSRNHNAGDSIVAAFIAVLVGVALLPLRRLRPTLRNVLLYPKLSKQKHALA
jgi:hypothetical protein